MEGSSADSGAEVGRRPRLAEHLEEEEHNEDASEGQGERVEAARSEEDYQEHHAEGYCEENGRKTKKPKGPPGGSSSQRRR